MEFGNLRLLDLAIVLVYLVFITTAGLALRSRKTPRDYFLGEKAIPAWLLLFSIVATETSSVTFLSLPGLSWKQGGSMEFLQLAAGFLLGRILVARWFLPWFFRGDYLTAYQVLHQRFDLSVQQTASGLFLVMRTFSDGLRLFLTALLVTELTTLNPGWSILITGLFTLVYTSLGGMRAVLWTDLLQFVLYIAGAVLIFSQVILQLPGGWDQFIDLGQSANKFQVFHFWVSSTDSSALGGLSASFGYPFWFPAGIIGGAFLSMASHGSDQMMVQRYLCASSQKSAVVALVGSGFLVFFQFALFLLIGIGLYSLQASGVWSPLGEIHPDMILGRFVVDRLAPGLAGFVVAAVLAAAMSTLSSSLNSSASAVVGDFVRPFFPGISRELEMDISRWTTVVCGFLQMFVAWTAWGAIGDQAVIEMVLALAGFLSGLLLGLFLLGIMNVPVRSNAAFGGIILGGSIVLFVWLPTLWDKPYLSYPWYAPLGALSTWGIGYALDLSRFLGKPPLARPIP